MEVNKLKIKMYMKTRNLVILGIAVAAAFGCKKYPAVEPDNSTPRTANYTIERLVTEFGSEKGDVFPVRPNSGTLGLFSVDTIPSAGEDIIIAGRITSDDYNGNIYKYIVIQDLNSDYSLKVSVDASGISAYCPLGTIITVRCNGLALGKYADMFQLGIVYFNNNVDANKKGYEPGRIPLSLFTVRAETNGMSEPDKIKVDTLTIAQVLANQTNRAYHSRLVCIKNVYFTQTGDAVNDPDRPTDRIIFAPSTNNIGYPQALDIKEVGGTQTVEVCTSEYSRFANVTIPATDYKGTITAIMGWYRDKSGNNGSVQLTLRSLDDLQLYSATDGSKWVPDLLY
jgi:hypothetical protein